RPRRPGGGAAGTTGRLWLECGYTNEPANKHTTGVLRMSRMIFCKKYKKEMEGLDKPPYPGPKGQDVFDNVSKQAWQDWQSHQTMLINEKHLSLVDPEARKYLQGEMD